MGIISGALIIIAAFLIPLIIQLKKTAVTADNFLRETREELTPLLAELKQSTERLNRVTEGIEDSVRNVRNAAHAVGETGKLVDELNSFVRKKGLSFTVMTASIGMGVKTALSTLAKGVLKKEPEKKEDS